MRRNVFQEKKEAFIKKAEEKWDRKCQNKIFLLANEMEQNLRLLFLQFCCVQNMSGAGGGGFVMLMVEPTRKKELINALKKLNGFVMPFHFTEGGAHGWKIYSTNKV